MPINYGRSGYALTPLRFFFCEKTGTANRPKSLCKFVQSHCAIYAIFFFDISYGLPRKSDDDTKIR